MAEFLTMEEAEHKFGTKGKTNAALTLGIIGTAIGAFAGNNGGCGNGGFTLGKVKFGEADVDELFRMFGEIKQTNT